MSDQRYVITIATGKPLYLDMAVNLARSFFWWHPETDIIFQLVTDQQELIPADVRSKVQVISINNGELGEGFSPKLSLDKLVSEGQTLFIDSDCLIFGNLEHVFDAFKGHKVSVVGGYIGDGEWFGDVKNICAQFNIPHMPKFNGGIYYLEKGFVADEVYKNARELEKRYDEIGFVRLRNRPNDEVLMAIAMQLHGQTPIPDDGTIMSDPQSCPGKYSINVITGKRQLINPSPPHPLHQKWYPFEKVSPLVFHFLEDTHSNYQYKKEAYRLTYRGNAKLSWAADINAAVMIAYPAQIKTSLKKWLRPIYNLLFGTRPIKKSFRL